MDWQERLIGLYVYICVHYKTHLWVHAQRLSNNRYPKFTDEEVLTLPCVIANAKRSGKARVAGQIASKGWCASKGMWYYGVKVHILAKQAYKGLPKPDYISLTGAADHDLAALRPLLPYLHNGTGYGDKIYANKTLKDTLLQKQNLAFYTPVKKKVGQDILTAADHVLSGTVSRIRQPIESLFAWIDDKTGIQKACKVRSYDGLIVHIFGRLAAACFLIAFYS